MLTIKSMVENAISHGVRIREEGFVSVTKRRTDCWQEIIIKDNGTGFDVDKAHYLDKTHIGLRIFRERIEKICGETFTAASVIGEGS